MDCTSNLEIDEWKGMVNWGGHVYLHHYYLLIIDFRQV